MADFEVLDKRIKYKGYRRSEEEVYVVLEKGDRNRIYDVTISLIGGGFRIRNVVYYSIVSLESGRIRNVSRCVQDVGTIMKAAAAVSRFREAECYV